VNGNGFTNLRIEPVHGSESSFWPSFTDIMMVIVMVFLIATSVLIVRNWQLVTELQESIDAERLAAQMVESTSQENATLEEQLVNTQQELTFMRLQLLDREEKLQKTRQQLNLEQQATLALQQSNQQLQTDLQQARLEQQQSEQIIAALQTEVEQYTSTIAGLEASLQQRIESFERLKIELSDSQQTLEQQQQTLASVQAEVEQLLAEKQQSEQERANLQQQLEQQNQELLTLQGDYDIVKAKYEKLIKPARTAVGKFVAEVHYDKLSGNERIRYKASSGATLEELDLQQLNQNLQALKDQHGRNLYVKIIIPKESGLTYNEAWGFMKELLNKYDYYYQQDSIQ